MKNWDGFVWCVAVGSKTGKAHFRMDEEERVVCGRRASKEWVAAPEDAEHCHLCEQWVEASEKRADEIAEAGAICDGQVEMRCGSFR